MANEATKIELYGHNSAGEVMPFTISSSTAIPKGSVMVLSATPRTITIHDSIGQKFVGVTNVVKDSLDTSTQLGVYTNGIFNFAASNAILDGDKVITSTVANFVEASAACMDPTIIVGMAFGDAAAGRVDVRILK